MPTDKSTGYSSDLTSSSQLALSDSPRPSLRSTRARSSYRAEMDGSKSRPDDSTGVVVLNHSSARESIQFEDELKSGEESSGRRGTNLKGAWTWGSTDPPSVRPLREGRVKGMKETSRTMGYDSSIAQSTESSASPLEETFHVKREELGQTPVGGTINSEEDSSTEGLTAHRHPILPSQDPTTKPFTARSLINWIFRNPALRGWEYDLLESGSSSGAYKMHPPETKRGSASSKRKKTRRGTREGKSKGDAGGVGKEWERVGRKGLGRVLMSNPVRIVLGLIVFLSLLAVFLTKLLKYLLNPDKAPLPWREYCLHPGASYHVLSPSPSTSTWTRSNPLQSETGFSSPSTQPFIPLNSSHQAWPWSSPTPPYNSDDDSVDQLDPVGIFIGIMSIDYAREKRMLIRQTYGTHPKSRTRGTEGVVVKFILGRPKASLAREVELEIDTFGDIVILDMEENMNSGKTFKYFNWAAENATVPEWSYVLPHPDPSESEPPHRSQEDFTILDERSSEPAAGLLAHNPLAEMVYKGEKKPDYVFKADDDAFIVLGEMERRLRVVPRKQTFWGYLIKNQFMGGECYGMSFDLVEYIANHIPLRSMTKGKEDKLVSKWMKMHPKRDEIVWVSERCAIYDHPKAGTVYSHGFLFPSVMEQVRHEDIDKLSPFELQWRGGKNWASTYSTVSHFGTPYTPPLSYLSSSQQVEALIEGSEMSLLSLLHAANHRNAQVRPDWMRAADEEELVEKVFNRRPSRAERFRHDPKERGGTVVVHFIKKEAWFLETALALLGSRNDTIL